ncbi:MAG: aminotransferase [Archaeoglobus sp.]|jgi:aspartate aminotransferase-like enzyme|nr:MAG: aminotransferase [Archaeoglobus sp.]
MDVDDMLMIPGPVQLHSRISRAMSKQMIGHRGSKFSETMAYCVEGLKEMFGTKGDVYLITGSGTAGLEAAIASFSSVKRITCVDNGKFGDRLGRIASRYTKVDVVRFEWGKAIEIEDVEKSIAEGSEALAFVHNETSTAMLNPARELAKLAKKYDCITLMDAITSVGGDYVKMDEWGIDVAIVGSQKCLGIPPGLAAVAVSNERVWDFYNEKCPFYLDLSAYRKKAKDNQTPYTPAVSLFFALEEAVKMVREEGLENRIKRHRTLAKAVREWAKNAGLELFPQPNEISDYSNTVTAINLPEGVTDRELRGTLLREYGITISGGQEHLKGKIFRIGNMGNIGKREIVTTLAAIEDILSRFDACKPALYAAFEVLRSL